MRPNSARCWVCSWTFNVSSGCVQQAARTPDKPPKYHRSCRTSSFPTICFCSFLPHRTVFNDKYHRHRFSRRVTVLGKSTNHCIGKLHRCSFTGVSLSKDGWRPLLFVSAFNQNTPVHRKTSIPVDNALNTKPASTHTSSCCLSFVIFYQWDFTPWNIFSSCADVRRVDEADK